MLRSCVGGQEEKHFSPLGTKPYFHENSSRKILLPPCNVVASEENPKKGPKPGLLERFEVEG